MKYSVVKSNNLTSQESLTINTEYPIGYLDDIEIHFMHYQSITEVKEKWERRTKKCYNRLIREFLNLMIEMAQPSSILNAFII